MVGGRLDADDLKTEILAMSKLSEQCSDYVAKYHDVIFVERENMLYILMELIRGKDLNRHSAWANPDEYEIHERIARGLANGLKCLHDNRIAHRDIKPENAMANESLSILKWVDLGFSCVTFCKLGQTPVSVGTPLFWAPEIMSGQIDGSLSSWQAADVYSFGLVLHEMCGGNIKLATENGGAELVGDGPAISKSQFVSELMRKCLIKDPAERYEQWQIFLDENP